MTISIHWQCVTVWISSLYVLIMIGLLLHTLNCLANQNENQERGRGIGNNKLWLCAFKACHLATMFFTLSKCFIFNNAEQWFLTCSMGFFFFHERWANYTVEKIWHLIYLPNLTTEHAPAALKEINESSMVGIPGQKAPFRCPDE